MNGNDDGVIKISREEVESSHVDDLLKRQMSLRGEAGVTRDRSRAWWYQNWIVFMLVGVAGAVGAWAILEPVFDDELYLQGPIGKIDANDSLASTVKRGGQEFQLSQATRGSIEINGQRIHLLKGVREILPDGTRRRLELTSLRAEETVGVYVEYVEGGGEDGLALANYVVRSPKPVSSERAKMTLSHLAARSRAAGLMTFSLVAGLVGLLIGAADGLICRLPRRAALCGLIGLMVGLVGGFVSNIIANIVYMPLNQLAERQWTDGSLSTFGFMIQMVGRSLAWCLAGLAMGLGQGIALRSRRLLIYGLLGGTVGGLMGGLLFDPIDLLVLGPDKPSAHWSRLIGFGVIGAGVGAMIGVVELLARDAWLRMTQGPLTGKEFLVFKDVMKIGSSPRSDIYLFNDPLVADHHATLRAVGDECEIEAEKSTHPVLINTRTVTRGRLRHGDNITVGRTAFVFQRRKG